MTEEGQLGPALWRPLAGRGSAQAAHPVRASRLGECATYPGRAVPRDARPDHVNPGSAAFGY